MVSSSTRAVSCPSQAKLLRGRGDLRGKRGSFDVQLERPSPGALQAKCPFDRIGMDLRRAEVPERSPVAENGEVTPATSKRLLVTSVDTNPRRKTPIARWNSEEERQAIRTDEESHRSLALLPGDRLRAVNGVTGQTAMLAELVDAMSSTSPREVNLNISRNISDVMETSPKQRVIGGSTTPPKLPRVSKQADSLTAVAEAMIGSPPRTPPRTSCGRPCSRASSAGSVTSTRCGSKSSALSTLSGSESYRSRSASQSSITSTRSRSGSRRNSLGQMSSWGQIDCGQGVGVSLSHAGRMALAF